MRSQTLVALLTFSLCIISHAEVPTAAQSTRCVSWNAYSRQFIDPPTFTLLPLNGTATYQAVVKQGDKQWHAESKTPDVSLAEIWPNIAVNKFALSFEWLAKNGKVIATDKPTDRVKAPDFAGFTEPPEDWKAAADRGTAYLLEVSKHGKAPYREPGVPIWIWSASTPAPNQPEGQDSSYPCITIPNIIWAMTGCARTHGAQSAEALQIAEDTADWTLTHRHANSGALPLFPYSTVSHGHFEGGVEGQAVNMLRADWYAGSLVDLYEATGKRNAAYLDYARHIANVTAKFQAMDGSFPYRVNPKTGAVVETYTPAAIEFVGLVDSLKPYGVTDDLLKAQHRAAQWMISYVIATHHWQAIFEDVSAPLPYSNLSQFETQMMVRYLCHHRAENPHYVAMAEELNRWIEDQFVMFTVDDMAFERRVKGPVVFEQFVCWFPMEGHTGAWIRTLIDLHEATGKQIYLDKAKAAANAICAQQFPDGSFSTWAVRQCIKGKIVGQNTGGNWYNTNAMGVDGLYRLAAAMKK